MLSLWLSLRLKSSRPNAFVLLALMSYAPNWLPKLKLPVGTPRNCAYASAICCPCAAVTTVPASPGANCSGSFRRATSPLAK